MGFNINTIRVILNAKQLDINFEKVVAIGRQEMDIKEQDFQKLLDKSNLKKIKLEKYFESFFRLLGAKITDSIDFSPYEGATIIHDMNSPIPDKYKSKYTLVIDGGSLEHIFNFPIAIKNCMELIEKNGYYIGITPTNNYSGHGFYQFSPELYYTVFNESNGFRIVKMYFYIDDRSGKTPIFEISDPNEVKQRVNIQNSYRSLLFVIAQKIEETEIFKNIPQQSDYKNIVWKGLSDDKGILKSEFSNFFKQSVSLSYKKKSAQIKKIYKLIFRQIGLASSQFIKKTNDKIVEL